MTIKEFFVRFGTDTTTNFALMQWANELGIPLHYCMKDEIKKLKRVKKYPIYCIANYHTSTQPGVHHVALYKSKEGSFYVDSFGIEPLKEAKDFLEHGVYSTFQIQSMNQTFCGQVSLYILYCLHNKADFYDIVLNLNDALNS